jgi:hypothetical protein
MTDNSIHRGAGTSLITLASVVGVGIAGIYLWFASTVSSPVWLPPAILGAAALMGLSWQLRIRAARRWQASLDAYAEREMTRIKAPKAPKKSISGIAKRINSRRKLHAYSQPQDW